MDLKQLRGKKPEELGEEQVYSGRAPFSKRG